MGTIFSCSLTYGVSVHSQVETTIDIVSGMLILDITPMTL